jgi:DNA-binding response OmpR family regulator
VADVTLGSGDQEDDMNDVVVVEDDPDIQILTGMLLEAHGHATRRYSAGRTAVEACIANPPSVVLLDWMMPEMSGLDVLRALRAHPATAHVPVVMVTALDRPENLAAAFDNGASDYVRKPFTGRSLLAAVERQLAARAVPEQGGHRLSA